MLSALVTRLGLSVAGRVIPWGWVAVAGGAVAAALAIAILWLRLDAVAAERDLALAHRQVLADAHAATLDTLDAIQDDHRRQMAAVSSEVRATRERAARYATIAQEVSDAPADGCVGPGVRAALRGLHAAADRD